MWVRSNAYIPRVCVCCMFVCKNKCVLMWRGGWRREVVWLDVSVSSSVQSLRLPDHSHLKSSSSFSAESQFSSLAVPQSSTAYPPILSCPSPSPSPSSHAPILSHPSSVRPFFRAAPLPLLYPCILTALVRVTQKNFFGYGGGSVDYLGIPWKNVGRGAVGVVMVVCWGSHFHRFSVQGSE